MTQELALQAPAPRPPGEENRFLAVLGPSGSGKSSLARAGLIPALKRGELDGSADWPVVVFKPGRDPLESLAVALAGLDGGKPSAVAMQGLMGALRAEENTLHLTTRLALRDAPADAAGGAADRPVRGGLHALRRRGDPQGPLRQPGLRRHGRRRPDGGRPDDAGRLLRQVRPLPRAGGGPVRAPAPGRADDRGRAAPAIERPAQLAGGEFEPGLVEVLLQDVSGSPGRCRCSSSR